MDGHFSHQHKVDSRAIAARRLTALSESLTRRVVISFEVCKRSLTNGAQFRSPLTPQGLALILNSTHRGSRNG